MQRFNEERIVLIEKMEKMQEELRGKDREVMHLNIEIERREE
jgi:hypothetical protein